MAKKKTKNIPKKRLAKPQPVPEAAPSVVVFYELNGVAGVRFHADYADIERARLAARALVSSPDVDQAWIIRDLVIIKRAGG